MHWMNASGHIRVNRSSGWSASGGGRSREGEDFVERWEDGDDWSTFVNIVLRAARNVPRRVRIKPQTLA